MSTKRGQNGHLNSFLENELDRLVEEFRELEELLSDEELLKFEQILQSELLSLPDRFCKLIVLLMQKKDCSLKVAAAAAIAFSALYSDDDFDLQY